MDRRGRRDGFVAEARWATRRGRAYHLRVALRTAKHLPWLLAAAFVATNAQASDFNFYRDTFAFANATVFKYYKGIAFLRAPSGKTDPANSYTRRCFVMTRVVMQFHKFARFDPHGQPLDDRALAARVRAVTRPAPWRAALPPKERIVFPGYSNLREMSKARETVLKENIGAGWPTYFRPGNFRMFYQRSPKYQEQTHSRLDVVLAHGDFFIAYLTTYPRLSINHAVLIYARKNPDARSDIERYLVYDPNHPDSPRELTWLPREDSFAYQKDVDFVGGHIRVYQSYGKWLQ